MFKSAVCACFTFWLLLICKCASASAEDASVIYITAVTNNARCGTFPSLKELRERLSGISDPWSIESIVQKADKKCTKRKSVDFISNDPAHTLFRVGILSECIFSGYIADDSSDISLNAVNQFSLRSDEIRDNYGDILGESIVRLIDSVTRFVVDDAFRPLCTKKLYNPADYAEPRKR